VTRGRALALGAAAVLVALPWLLARYQLSILTDLLIY
jgi:hypothetical protein